MLQIFNPNINWNIAIYKKNTLLLLLRAHRCDYVAEYFSLTHTAPPHPEKIVIFIKQAVRKCEENCKSHYRCNLGKNLSKFIYGCLEIAKKKSPVLNINGK